MYVAVKGGEAAIDAAHELLAHERRGDPEVPEISPDQIREQLTLAVHRVMSEGSLYDPDLAALAVKQARGDLIEAIFLLRAYRTTLPRFGYSVPLETASMTIRRRISATYKDLPGGQILGPTFDYTHRLLEPEDASGEPHREPRLAEHDGDREAPHVSTLLDQQGLIEKNVATDQADRVRDLTRDPIAFPTERDVRLQALARGDEGFLLALGYSTQRGYGRTHPFAGEIRIGEVDAFIVPEELGFPVPLGAVTVTECEMVNQFKGTGDTPPQFTRGYGLAFGHSERKTMAMALVDRSMRARDLGEEIVAPAQDEEFVLSHCDNVQATGFVEHLKLPHYVDFQAELALLRQLRREWSEARSDETTAPGARREAAE
ncbi:MAG: carbon-phosphorus lyase complex subunit PhnI [Hyphomicrobiaceae bacterium]